MAAPNENTAPTPSVIIPVYNGENYLREAIDSVRNQTFQDLELIVVDDGSTDATSAIVQAYGALVAYVRQNNQGTAAAFNHGLRLARGKYISGTAVYADGFAREHVEYHRYWLDKLPLAELFPDHRPNATPSERAEMHRWLGDRLSARPAPVCWVAAQEYRKAMRADPLRTPFFSAKLAKLYWRRLRSTAK